MKPRARRIPLLTVGAACLVVAGVVILNWSLISDHVEAWRFVAARKTDTLQPGDQAPSLEERRPVKRLFQILADISQRAVVCDSEEMDCPIAKLRLPENTSTGKALRALRASGYRILEQHVPRRAYVVTGYPDIQLPRGLLERANVIRARQAASP
jgi:hypothetical protein